MRVLKNPKVNLENKRKIFYEIGLIVALILVFAAFEYRTYDKYELPDYHKNGLFVIEDMAIRTVHKKPPPPPPVKRKPPIIKIVDDSEIDDSPDIEIDALTDETEENWDLPELAEDTEIVEIQPFVSVQQMPEFPGGLSGLYKYFRDNLRYPTRAKELGISGTVYIRFIVERDGSISNVEIYRGIGGGCDEEAVRIVNGMPQWEPGRQRGTAVRVLHTIPLKFTLR